MPNLYVAMYHPKTGNHENWALYLEDDEDTVYEVIGEFPKLKLKITFAKPVSTVRHKRNIFVYEINSIDISEFENVISAVKSDCFSSYWNSQDYVIEVLERLEAEGVINEDDKKYIRAKTQIRKHVGPLW